MGRKARNRSEAEIEHPEGGPVRGERSESKSHQAMNKKSIRGRRGGMSWHNTAKSPYSAPEVNGTLGWRRFPCLPGEISSTGGVLRHAAPTSAMAAVRGEKSAEAIVIEETSRSASAQQSCRSDSPDEGPNQSDEPTQSPAHGDEPDRGSLQRVWEPGREREFVWRMPFARLNTPGM